MLLVLRFRGRVNVRGLGVLEADLEHNIYTHYIDLITQYFASSSDL